MKHLILAACLMLFWSCRKDPALWHVSNLNGDKVLVLGHGGMGYRSRLPMNSLESVRSCLETGADGVEVDLQLSRDSVFVLFHDEALDRSTDCGGKVEQQTISALENCHYRKNGDRHALVRARQVVDLVQAMPGKYLTLECKAVPGDLKMQQRHVRRLAALLEGADLSRVMIETTDSLFSSLLISQVPGAEVYFYCGSLEQALELHQAVPIAGLTINMDRISAAEIRQAHLAGLKVTVFNAASERENFDALALSPDQIQSDLPRHLAEAYVKKR